MLVVRELTLALRSDASRRARVDWQLRAHPPRPAPTSELAAPSTCYQEQLYKKLIMMFGILPRPARAELFDSCVLEV